MDANFAHICLHKLKKFPHEYMALPRKEKIFVIASFEIEAANRKKEEEKAAREAKNRRNRGKGKRR